MRAGVQYYTANSDLVVHKASMSETWFHHKAAQCAQLAKDEHPTAGQPDHLNIALVGSTARD
jgi:hypothetical protein